MLPLGIRVPGPGERPETRGDGPPLILWNHRWEHDKAPEVFFRVLERLAAAGARFRVAVAGEGFRRVPPAFEKGRAAYRWIQHLPFVLLDD